MQHNHYSTKMTACIIFNIIFTVQAHSYLNSGSLNTSHTKGTEDSTTCLLMKNNSRLAYCVAEPECTLNLVFHPLACHGPE